MTDSQTHGTTARVPARCSMDLVRALARAAGDGLHHLSVVLSTPEGVGRAECVISGPVPNEGDENDPLAYLAFLLAQTATGASAVLVARTLDSNGEVTLMSWMVRDIAAYPATAEQSVIAYCIDEDYDLTDLVPGVTFVDAPALR
ncbi:hypothetical protein [Streptomyces sp. NPDC087297]|uniref:hypothetical protein n=1 Tax=Streptomyces sp. NPDC087297 TaxID=3365778 RepID=UPI00381A0229